MLIYSRNIFFKLYKKTGGALKAPPTLFLLAGLLFFSYLSKAQTTDTTQFLKTLPLSTSFVTTDVMQQIYAATVQGKILKFDTNGKLLFEYSNNRLGSVGTIDATNPFNILVYYPDLATIILLDRTLSLIKEINLFDLAIFEARAVAMANDNNIWVYDPINYQLKKINKEGGILFQSRNLNQTLGFSIQPSFLLERNNQLFLSDTLHGIFVFDNFGQLEQQLPLKGVASFQVSNKQLIYFQENKLKYFSLEAGNEIALPIEKKPLERVVVLQENLLLVKKDTVFLIKR